MNVADHQNRAKYIEPKLNRVLGVLLGKQEGRAMEIFNTVEICYKVENKEIVVDAAFMKGRLEAYKKMFPTLDCVGWYSAQAVSSSDIDLPSKGDLPIQ